MDLGGQDGPCWARWAFVENVDKMGKVGLAGQLGKVGLGGQCGPLRASAGCKSAAAHLHCREKTKSPLRQLRE